MTQLDAELRRFAARRIVRGGALLVVVVMVFVIVLVTLHGHVRPDRFTSGLVDDTRTDVHEWLRGALEGTGVATLFLAFVLGASFVGPEFGGGSLSTQLLFEPRRWHVHLAKAGAVTLGTAAVSLVTSVALALSLLIGSVAHGRVHDLDVAWWSARFVEALRIALAVGLGGAMAYTVTLMFRRSSAGILVFFFQYPLLFLVDPDRQPFGALSGYAPLRGLLAFVADPGRSGGGIVNGPIRSVTAGAVLTAVWAVVLVVAAGLVFARSEVR